MTDETAMTQTHASLQMIDGAELQTRQRTIVQVMQKTMVLGIHYGVPYKGSKKNVLLKPGAEVLGVLFQLAPSYDVTQTDLGAGHREIRISCKLTYIPTERFIAEGLGSCSTKETKYRYRNLDKFTGIAAPYEANRKRKESFKVYQSYLRDVLTDNDIDVPDSATLGHGKNKDSGQWEISIKNHGENPDIADEYNTVLKMAKKRAHIDAILNATGASELFTQDVEDLPDYDPTADTNGDGNPGPGADPKAGAANRSQSKRDRYEPGSGPQPGRPPATASTPDNDEQRPTSSGSGNGSRKDPADMPAHLKGIDRAAKAWRLTGDLPAVRQADLRSALMNKDVKPKTVSHIATMAEMYLASMEYINLISDGMSQEDAEAWHGELKKVSSAKGLQNLYEAVKKEVEEA